MKVKLRRMPRYPGVRLTWRGPIRGQGRPFASRSKTVLITGNGIQTVHGGTVHVCGGAMLVSRRVVVQRWWDRRKS